MRLVVFDGIWGFACGVGCKHAQVDHAVSTMIESSKMLTIFEFLNLISRRYKIIF